MTPERAQSAKDHEGLLQRQRRIAIVEAAQALSDLNVFAIVVSTLENGHVHASSYVEAQRVIKICNRIQQKLLRIYDRAVEKAGGGTYG